MEGIFLKNNNKKKQISEQKHNKNEKKKKRVLSRIGTRQFRFYATLPYHYTTRDDYVHLALPPPANAL